MSDTNNGNGNPENPEEDVLLDKFDAQTDKELEEAGDDPEKLREIIKIRTESRQKLYARTKEAESKLKTFASENKESKKDTSKSTGKDDQPKEFDYGQKAYLIAKGIETEEEESFLFKEVSETGKTLSQVLGFQYVQEHLKTLKEQKNSEGAIPKGSGERGGQGNRNTVDYWIQKGELPPEDQVELRRKVVNEKLKRAQTKGKFGGSGEVQIV